MVFPSGGWHAGLCWTILVVSPESHRSYWVREKTAHRATKQRGRNSIAMVVEKKRGTVGKTVRDNCECKIISQADSWMVPGWELITPVGAPLEVVVDSAETTEEGGSI